LVKNINYEKVKLHFAVGRSFFCLSKVNPSPEEQSAIPVAGKSSIVFFVDTFGVYTINHSDASQKFVYSYKPEYNTNQQIKIVNANGTNKKLIKTLAKANISLTSLSGFGSKILYTITDYSTTNPVYEIRLMNEAESVRYQRGTNPPTNRPRNSLSYSVKFY